MSKVFTILFTDSELNTVGLVMADTDGTIRMRHEGVEISTRAFLLIGPADTGKGRKWNGFDVELDITVRCHCGDGCCSGIDDDPVGRAIQEAMAYLDNLD